MDKSKKFKIIRSFQKAEFSPILTIGNFDGLHLGHQAIFDQMQILAKKHNFQRALITFEPHPIKIIKLSKYYPQRVLTLSNKLKLLRKENLINVVYLINFTRNLAEMNAVDFVKNILVHQMRVRHLFVGYDFTFGKDKAGNFALLQKMGLDFGFNVIKIDQKKINNEVISSTRIRKLIGNGEISLCNKMLGRNYQISGRVVEGQRLARKLGFPTANIAINPDLVGLKKGVYKVRVLFQGKNEAFSAVANFGIKPTFGDNKICFEVHILNFNYDIYGHKITVEIIDFIREERCFSSVDELKKAIYSDCKNAL